MTKKSKQNGSSLNKRWFAMADGWGVSFQVGSGEPTKGKRSLPVSVEQKFLALPVTISGATEGTLYSYNPLANIVKGVASNQRIGDGIKLKGMSFRFLLNSAVSVPSVWRVLIVAATPQFTGTNFGSGLGFTQLFFNASASVPLVDSHVDSRLAKVLCDTTYDLKPRVTGQPDTHFSCLDCEVNSQFNFQTGGVFGEASNLYIVVVSSTPGGVNGTTATGSLNGEVLVSWAD
jgi:hypothetical protein